MTGLDPVFRKIVCEVTKTKDSGKNSSHFYCKIQHPQKN